MMRATLIALLATSALACSSYPAPTQRLTTATAAARSAEMVGANTDPQARRHLDLAKRQIEQAKREMSTGDNKQADFTLVRAKADADLAIAQTKESALQSEARTAVARVDALREQVNSAQAARIPIGTTTTTGAPLPSGSEPPAPPVLPSTDEVHKDVKDHAQDMKVPRTPKVPAPQGEQ